jgi:micrococcal nuclease
MRKVKQSLAVLTGVLLIPLLLLPRLHAAVPLPPRPTYEGRIVRWVDGDTVHVFAPAGPGMATEKVRLIGIDAPETSYGERAARQGAELGRDVRVIVTLGRKAKVAAERMAPPGTVVRIELDVVPRDRYGRLLAYLWLPNGRMVNEELVRQGWAMVYTIPPNVRYVERFLKAQREAREARRGLWGGDP